MKKPPGLESLVLYVCLAGMLISIWGCSTKPVSAEPTNELILFDWSDDIPLEILEDYEEQTGTKIHLVTYESMEEAVQRIKEGLVFDVAVVENDQIPGLVSRELLAEIDKVQVPNFRNIDPAFRDLSYDPDNRYTVPYSWGTSGLLVKSHLVNQPITRWSDLWEAQYAGKVALREQPTELISVALKSLGYPLNSENPEHLQEAYLHLQELSPLPGFLDTQSEIAVITFLNSRAVVMVGWQEDAILARKYDERVIFVLPEEGSMLWGDNFVISRQSSNPAAAHALINYLLGAEVSARIVNEKGFATTNEAATIFIDPEIRNDPIVFPTHEDLIRSEWYMPLSEEGKLLYEETWLKYKESLQP